MSNSLSMDLTGKVVIFKQQHLTVPALEHPFRVTGGFGAKPDTIGKALIGEFLSDGERARMEGYMVERLATDEEIARFENQPDEIDGGGWSYRLWVNDERTVLVTLWESGDMTVARREHQSHTWGAPITVVEERRT